MPCILLVGRSIEIRRLERARAGKLRSPTEGDKALSIRIDVIHRPCIAQEFNGYHFLPFRYYKTLLRTAQK